MLVLLVSFLRIRLVKDFSWIHRQCKTFLHMHQIKLPCVDICTGGILGTYILRLALRCDLIECMCKKVL